MLGEHGGHEVFVFVGFEAAGGIHDATAGAESGEGRGQELGLGFAAAIDVLVGEAPAGIQAAAENAGIGAGGIDQDTVEGSLGGGVFGSDHLDIGGEALDIIEETTASSGIGFGGHDGAVVIDGLS
jgi:hypothetical protein